MCVSFMRETIDIRIEDCIDKTRMYGIIRLITGIAVRILDVGIHTLSTMVELMDVFDTMVCKYTDTQKPTLVACGAGGTGLGRHIQRLCDAAQYQIYGAYTFQGKGISYTMAKEILSVRTTFDTMRNEYPDLKCMYKAHIDQQKTFPRVLSTSDVSKAKVIEELFAKMVIFQCVDVDRLIIQRTYNHPCFGDAQGSVTLYELETDARITTYDINYMLVCIIGSSMRI